MNSTLAIASLCFAIAGLQIPIYAPRFFFECGFTIKDKAIAGLALLAWASALSYGITYLVSK